MTRSQTAREGDVIPGLEARFMGSKSNSAALDVRPPPPRVSIDRLLDDVHAPIRGTQEEPADAFHSRLPERLGSPHDVADDLESSLLHLSESRL